MKFEEKLIKLRKQKAMSQEDLAEKLGVTIQTVSEWELGQTKPEMDKLVEISKLLDVNIDNLTNDNIELGEKTSSDEKENKNLLKIAIIVIVVGISILFIVRTVLTMVALNRFLDKGMDKIVGESGSVVSTFFDIFFDVSGKFMEKVEEIEANQTKNEEAGKAIDKYESFIDRFTNQMDKMEEDNENIEIDIEAEADKVDDLINKFQNKYIKDINKMEEENKNRAQNMLERSR